VKKLPKHRNLPTQSIDDSDDELIQRMLANPSSIKRDFRNDRKRAVQEQKAKMRDFSKTQSNKPLPLKCNTCGRIFKAFGSVEGEICRAPLNTGDPNQPTGNRCTGSLFEISEVAADQVKRRSDGNAG
jgi:hypothetical protein